MAKIVDHAIFSCCAEIRRNSWVPIQGCTAVDPSIQRLADQKEADLSRCVRTRIAIVNNDSFFLVRFLSFSEDFIQTNCAVPLRIYRPTMLKWNSSHMISFAEETGHHLLRSDFSTNNFHWIWLGFKEPPTRWTVALFWAHTHRSMIRQL